MADNFTHFKVHRKSGRNRGPRKAPKKDGPCKKVLRSERRRSKEAQGA